MRTTGFNAKVDRGAMSLAIDLQKTALCGLSQRELAVISSNQR
ncbi:MULTISPECIES: hypothetical protein [unclassified Limnothrix]|nr:MULTISPECIES: hypothetical protein [unclassified Limnothrix]